MENYSLDDEPSLVIFNHICFMNIFYLAMAIPDFHVSVVSLRVLYKEDRIGKNSK